MLLTTWPGAQAQSGSCGRETFFSHRVPGESFESRVQPGSRESRRANGDFLPASASSDATPSSRPRVTRLVSCSSALQCKFPIVLDTRSHLTCKHFYFNRRVILVNSHERKSIAGNGKRERNRNVRLDRRDMHTSSQRPAWHVDGKM